MKPRLDTAVTTVLVFCALVTTGLLIRRELVTGPPQEQAVQKPVLIEKWQVNLLRKSVRMGPPNAPVMLIEFADFECPFCASFHKSLKILRDRYPSEVALTFIQFPLPMHRFAEPAARVAECAADQGHFEPMHDLLFDQQDQLGLKSWADFAKEANVPDSAAFDACIQSTAPIPRVEEGKALGKKLDIQGTPTLIINGWKLPQPPSAEELDKMVKAVLDGKSPVSVL